MEIIFSEKMYTREEFINEIVKKLPKVKLDSVKKIYKYYSDNKNNFNYVNDINHHLGHHIIIQRQKIQKQSRNPLLNTYHYHLNL